MSFAQRGSWSSGCVALTVAAALLGVIHGTAHAQAVPDLRTVQLAKLQEAARENALALDSANTPWPYVTMGLGLGVGLGAGIAGMAIVAGCESDDCSVSAAVGGLVVAGVAVITAGVLWWRLQEQKLRRLESKQYQLERDLERLKLTMSTSAPKDTASLSWRLRF